MIAKKDYTEAVSQAEAMLDYALKMRAPDHSYVLDVREWLADVLSASGQRDPAVREYALVLELLRKYHPCMKMRIRRIEDKIFKEREHREC